MNSDSSNPDNSDMQPEYDFTNGVQGKFAKQYAEGTNVVVLAPDLAQAFPDSDSVNRALRSLLEQREHGKESA